MQSKSKAKNNQHTGEQLLKDLLTFMQDLPAFTFVLWSDAASGVGPNLISALAMVECSSRATLYEGPVPESGFPAAKIEAARRYQEIIDSVNERVEQIQDAGGVSFVLFWQPFGDSSPTWDYSTEHEGCTAMEVVADFIQNNVLPGIIYSWT
jgi:hypothetical protein